MGKIPAAGIAVAVGIWGYAMAASLFGFSFGGGAASAASYAYQYLTVIKHVVNNDSGTATANQWSLHVQSGGTDVAGSPAPGSETGTTYFVSPGTYTVTETGGPSGYFFAGYSLDCGPDGSVTVSQSSEYSSCKLTNNDVGPIRSPGYWKNHLDAVAPLLPVSLGAYQVTTTAAASAVFAAGAGKCGTANAIGCLAAQLLSAKLDVANGTNTCIASTIVAADNLLVAVGYAGPTGSYPTTAAQRNTALSLANTLDRYNSQQRCPK